MVTFISSGRDYKIVNYALDTNFSDIAVSKSMKSFLLQAKEDVDVIWRKSVTDTDLWTLKMGSTLSVDLALGIQDGATLTIGQAKVASGTATLELWCFF